LSHFVSFFPFFLFAVVIFQIGSYPFCSGPQVEETHENSGFPCLKVMLCVGIKVPDPWRPAWVVALGVKSSASVMAEASN
jgi:hypothetical protein